MFQMRLFGQDSFQSQFAALLASGQTACMAVQTRFLFWHSMEEMKGRMAYLKGFCMLGITINEHEGRAL